VEPADCAAIVATYKAGSLFPGRLRGRSCYGKPIQAAERFLKNAEKYPGLDDLKLTQTEEIQPGQWSMTFVSRDGSQYRVSLAAEGGKASTYKSCSATELSPRGSFRLVECVRKPPESGKAAILSEGENYGV
jgi:hypothetical protein